MLIDINVFGILYYIIFAIIIWFVFKWVDDGKCSNTTLSTLVFFVLIIIFLMNQFGSISNSCPPCSVKKEYFETSQYIPQDTSKDFSPEYDNKYLNPTDPDLIAKQKREHEIANNIKSGYQYDMKYDQGNPLNTQPLGQKLYDNEYTYLPPSNWMRPFERPPVCVTDKRCPVCPALTEGTNSNLLEYEEAENLVGPVNINANYVNKNYK